MNFGKTHNTIGCVYEQKYLEVYFDFYWIPSQCKGYDDKTQ